MSLDYRKLAKICELLSSPNDGERAIAAQRASTMLRANNRTWTQIIEHASRITPCPNETAPRRPNTRFATHKFGWAAGDLVNVLELNNVFPDGHAKRFVAALHEKALSQIETPLSLTDVQWKRLADIAQRAGVDIAREAA